MLSSSSGSGGGGATQRPPTMADFLAAPPGAAPAFAKPPLQSPPRRTAGVRSGAGSDSHDGFVDVTAMRDSPRGEQAARRQEEAMRRLEDELRGLSVSGPAPSSRVNRPSHAPLSSPLRRGGGGSSPAAAEFQRTAVDELQMLVPGLSAGFTCSADDAFALACEITRSSESEEVSRLQDQLVRLEAENRALTTRLERKAAECSAVRDDLGEARQKLRAAEAAAKQQVQVLSQRREETRKQLITEEGRTAKLQMQNKVLQQDVERLKARVHSLLGGKAP